jgi:hypothetical protein
MASTPESTTWYSDLRARVLMQEIVELKHEIGQLQLALTVLADRSRPGRNDCRENKLSARSQQAETSFLNSLHRLSHCVSKLSVTTL